MADEGKTSVTSEDARQAQEAINAACARLRIAVERLSGMPELARSVASSEFGLMRYADFLNEFID